ncbi:hypothetical protein DH2020_032149 [Rehmannia glutinosa]|uniref:RNase H type-1 domain-containing protein n=1 Tax=Rehmannia glutinosa TaxID=99300 RepID=A0ABR0VG21_REHGL
MSTGRSPKKWKKLAREKKANKGKSDDEQKFHEKKKRKITEEEYKENGRMCAVKKRHAPTDESDDPEHYATAEDYYSFPKQRWSIQSAQGGKRFWVMKDVSLLTVKEKAGDFASYGGNHSQYPLNHTQWDTHRSYRPVHSRHGQLPYQRKKRFRFEVYWLEEEEFGKIIEEGWMLTTPEDQLYEKIKRCGEIIDAWAGTRFRKLAKTIADKRKVLNSLKVQNLWQESYAQIQEVEGQLEKLLSQEEGYWRQRSRNIWLAQGDANTKYFHAQATTRKSQNHIMGLISSHGDFCTKWSEFIAKEIVDIPLPASPVDDTRYWKFNERGQFTVRDGYRLESGDWTYWLHFVRFGSTLELCIWMQTNLAQEEFEAFATHTWLCWKERQRVIHGNGECSQIKMVEGAGKYLENFQKARLIHKNSSREVETEGLMKWIPPPEEKLRLDVDACVNFGKGLFGIGGVIRNWAGDPLLVFGKKIVNAGSILELELRAIKEGLEIACNAKVIPQFVASDSLLAIQAVIEDKEVGGYIEFWASKIKQILQSIESNSWTNFIIQSAL